MALLATVFAGCTDNDLDSETSKYTKLQKSSLPTVYIDTDNGTAIDSKETFVGASVSIIENGKLNTTAQAKIRGRGNSTWRLDKKPYRIEFDKKQYFGGQDNAHAKKWVMLANHADKTMLRNNTAFFIASQLGQPFAPCSRFVDLVLNDKYVGTYEISDFLQIKKDRIDAGDFGFFVEADGSYQNETTYFFSEKGIPFTVKDPDGEKIWPQQLQYIKDYVQHFENVLFSEDYLDPQNGYRALVDSLSLATWFLTGEFTANIDAYWSANIYKKGDGNLLYFGPVWDFDIAFNNCNRMGDVSEKMMMATGFGRNLIGIWLKRMWGDPWFRHLVCRTWQQARSSGIVNATLSHVDEMARNIDSSQQLNYSVWDIDVRNYNEMYLFDNYTDGVSFLKDFITKRAVFMDSTLALAINEPDAPVFNTNPFKPQNWYYNLMDEVDQWLIEADGNKVFLRKRNQSRSVEESWKIIPNSDNSAFMIVDRTNGMAFTDNSTAPGIGIVLEQADATNQRQWWQILDYYAFWTIRNSGTGYILKHPTSSSEEIVTDEDTPENRSLNNFKWHIMLAQPITE